MLLRFLSLLLVINLFDLQFCATQADQLYECYSWGDPHVQTWHLKGTDGLIHNQDCYTNGFYIFVRNEFVYFKVKVANLLQIEIDLRFYDETTRKVICMLESEHFEVVADDDIKCAAYGVTWNSTRVDDDFVLNVNYKRAKFMTTIKQFKRCTTSCHYNIYVWQPKPLALRSSGICEKGNNDCKRALETIDPEPESIVKTSQTRSITYNQAETICISYVNAFSKKSRRALYREDANIKNTINSVLAGCIEDLMLTGEPEMARSGLDVLTMEELTADVTSFDSLETTIQSGMAEALVMLNEAAELAELEVPEILGLTTLPRETTTTTAQTQTTTTVPVASFKCAVYQDMYIQTWHPSNQQIPPSRTCLGTAAKFELVKNKYVQYRLDTTGSAIDELTLILFDETSVNAICTVTTIGQDADWMDCEQNGIKPSFIKTATHEILTVYYAKANFTTIVTRDIGINVGRFNIQIYQSPELATQSAGVCNRLSSCTGSGFLPSNKRFRRQIN